MRLKIIVTVLAVTAATGVLAPPESLITPGRAAIEYPWCAQYGGGTMGGGRNCGFSTLEQCRVTIRGMGGFCEPNLFYPGSGSDTSKRERKRQH